MRSETKEHKRELFKRIDEISSAMREETNRNLLIKKLLHDKKIKNTKRYKDYQVIYKVLKEEFGDVISQETIYRILKIREASLDSYEKIKYEDVSIRAEYERLYGKKKQTPNSTNEDKQKQSELNTDDLVDMIKQINTYIDNNEDTLINKLSVKELKELDHELFILRKAVLSLMQKQDKKLNEL